MWHTEPPRVASLGSAPGSGGGAQGAGMGRCPRSSRPCPAGRNWPGFGKSIGPGPTLRSADEERTWSVVVPRKYQETLVLAGWYGLLAFLNACQRRCYIGKNLALAVRAKWWPCKLAQQAWLNPAGDTCIILDPAFFSSSPPRTLKSESAKRSSCFNIIVNFCPTQCIYIQ